MAKNIIELRNLTFTYAGKSSPALRQLNLEITAGSFVLITGLSGCGKSTLAYALCGFIPHGWPGTLEGDVILGGLNTRENTPEKLAGTVGLVQQDPDAQLCTFTVNQEVAFGLENLRLPASEVKSKTAEVLNRLGIGHLARREVASLSGGEKQRVALASILAMEPKILVLDEPTANLDPEGIADLTANLQTLKERYGYTVVVIEHRIGHFRKLADRMIVLQEGAIVADGRPEEVSPVYSRIVDQALVKSSELRNKQRVDYSAEPVLEVEKLDVKRGGRLVLKDISFRLYPGEIMAVMGSNGCGKTTLLLALLGYCKPERGTVKLFGQDISALDIRERVKAMGMVLQNPGHQILERTVWQEALLAAEMLKPEQDFGPEAKEYLRQFSLEKYSGSSPFLLSLGEKKRLCAVSTLVYHPDLLLLDEPLAGQDAGHLDLLLRHLYKHNEGGGAVLMVCHHPEVVDRFCHRLLFLENGQVGAEGQPAEIFSWLKERGQVAYLP